MPIFKRSDLYTPQNVAKTSGIVLEARGDAPLMTLVGNTQGGKLVDLRQLYIQYCVDDPTETMFVDAVFGYWAYWKKLSSSNFMKPYLKDWREEADVRRKSLAFATVLNEVRSDGKNAFQAAKYLIADPHLEKTKDNREHRKKTTELARKDFESDIIRLKDHM